MHPNKLRSLYLDFFRKQKHVIIPSAPLVPENDPTTLFTGSGMQPMIEYLLGLPHPQGKRIVDSQKCFRSQDIEEVGDNRHTTFFEMLGNWSLGDYFKKEQLAWFFEFLTSEVSLDPKRLYVTVFRGNEDLAIPRDVESVAIWKELFAQHDIIAKAVDYPETDGMQGGRIFYYDESKNWWSRAGVPANMPVGEPGGPDSEVFYDFDPEGILHPQSAFRSQPCHVNCDCGRFLEIGNSVFMQYQKQADGSFTLLKQQNVDFGGGFERILAAQLGTSDVFMTAAFEPILKHLERISGKQYAADAQTQHAFRVIADHIKAAVMLAGDGVFPSNKEQGYFARRLVRRAIRYARMIGIQQEFIADLVPVVISLYDQQYPQLLEAQTQIVTQLSQEETKFSKTIQKGLKEVEKHPVLDATLAFKLYETYGFPFELTAEIAQERGQILNKEKFDVAQKKHAQSSRAGSAEKFKGGLQDSSQQTTRYHTATHLLHAALRKIVGTHVQQKGSNITAERLRFDFSHSEALTQEQLSAVIQQINDWIAQALPVTVETMSKDVALQSGAIAFFIDKYPEQVTVYTIGTNAQENWISKEFCGGPHVSNTSEIGKITLVKESAVSQGVRRIYLN